MISSSFNKGWHIRSRRSIFAELGGGQRPRARPVQLPHDAMIEFDRAEEHGPHSGYYPGGAVEYLKEFDVQPEEEYRRHVLEFEGVYRHGLVYVNGNLAAHRPSGYVGFYVDLDPHLVYGGFNEIRVESRAHLDSRWYSGLGIYRDTFLHTSGLVHVAASGPRVSTPEVTVERASLELAVPLENRTSSDRTIDVLSRAFGPSGDIVASMRSTVTLAAGESTVIAQTTSVVYPALWSPDSPVLHKLTVTLLNGAEELDTASTSFGFRALHIDVHRGLQINGKTVKLRGACIHHDNGILGAATIRRADERRVELLQAAGFNAIRSAHNPISKALLDACDRLGMLVVDEAFDAWTRPKLAFDYGVDFPEWWERDLESMIEKDFNHPSVIIYSIGNEVLESGHPSGAIWAGRLAAKVKELDPSRYTTNAVNGLIAVFDEIAERYSDGRPDSVPDANTMMAQLATTRSDVAKSDLVTERTAGSYAAVDIAGLNYAASRYASDRVEFPSRVILGTETHGPKIAELWTLVNALPHVIGDFTWTGWDHLGEAGLGRTDYPENDEASFVITGSFPWLTSWAGDLDILGNRRPLSYFREIVYGLRTAPYIAVQRPEHAGQRSRRGPWSWSDSVASWAGDTSDGLPLVVEVYSSSDEVELLLNGRSLGRRPTGAAYEYRTEFEVPYCAGTLEAVAFDFGTERSRFSLSTASGPLHLEVSSDRKSLIADDHDLAYIAISIQDAAGTLATQSDRNVQVHVKGAGVLRALGSGRPVTLERFDRSEHSTFDGRLLAIVRPTAQGTIIVTCEGAGLAPVEITIEVTDPQSSADADGLSPRKLAGGAGDDAPRTRSRP